MNRDYITIEDDVERVHFPIKFYLQRGWSPLYIDGNWEAVAVTDEEEWPNVLVDEETEEFLLTTYDPPSRPRVFEVNVVRDTELGYIVNWLIHPDERKRWLRDDAVNLTTRDEFSIADIEIPEEKPFVMDVFSENPFSWELVIWFVDERFLDEVISKYTPFSTGSTVLLDGASEVHTRFGVPLESPRKRKSRGNPEKARELQEMMRRFEDSR
ncbi:hypothetical protein [Haladaptatus sp. ZSTT2]|uniref:hypothetical protein n=1 Tax=Haladaptatus sp. ZSTT2 TaxID=3120515 RepID=UPI00300EEC2A